MLGGPAYVVVVGRVAGDRRDAQPLDEAADQVVGAGVDRGADGGGLVDVVGAVAHAPNPTTRRGRPPEAGRLASARCAWPPSTCSAGGPCPTARCARPDLQDAAAALDADVVGLQEVDRAQDRSGGVDQTAMVAEALGARWSRFVPAVDGTPGGDLDRRRRGTTGRWPTDPAYGVGLVSRLPVLSWRVRRFGPAPFGMPLLVPGSRGLTHVPDEPRIALAAVVRGPGRADDGDHRAPVVRARAGTCGSCARSPGGRGRCRRRGCCSATSTCPARCPGWSPAGRSWPGCRRTRRGGRGCSSTTCSPTRRRRSRRREALRLPVSDHCALVVDLETLTGAAAHW